jgi:DNA-directed RNA polymerase subunit RPC12/RpoP
MLEKSEIEVSCPGCKRAFKVTLKQVANEEDVTCPGCSKRIHLKDSDGSVRRSLQAIDKELKKLRSSLKDINLNFRI